MSGVRAEPPRTASARPAELCAEEDSSVWGAAFAFLPEKFGVSRECGLAAALPSRKLLDAKSRVSP